MRIIQDNLHPQVLKNRLFINAIDYLIEHKIVEDQKSVSAKTGIREATLSNIRNDKKVVSNKTIRKFLENFPGIFNPEYFKGQNGFMTLKEVSEAKIDDELMNRREDQQPIDNSSLINATIAAKDETIASLRSQLEEKDALITAKDEMIQSLRQQLTQLRQIKDTMDDTFSSVESIKSQMEMLLSIYGTPHASDLFHTTVANDEPDDLHTFKFVKGKNGKQDLIAVIPQGLIRGGHPALTDELIKKAAELLNHPNRKK